MSFFRYPGGKKKLRKEILSKIESFTEESTVEFREPFFGGGSIGVEFLKRCCGSLFNSIKKVWINDFDIGISCLWTSVIRYPNEFKDKINSFVPSTSNFYEFKDFLRDMEKHRKTIMSPQDMVDIAFKKIAIHQMSYSGLGTMAGGPLGGEKQKSDYKVDCRWSPRYLCIKIEKTNELFKNFDVIGEKCSAHDFETLLSGSGSIVYLDPPYFEQGGNLYQFAFSERDHVRLSRVLKETQNKWLLSYDSCDQIKELYSWANIEEIDVNYSIAGSRTKKELLISPNTRCKSV